MLKTRRMSFNQIGTKLRLGLATKKPQIKAEWVEIKINPDGSIVMRASSEKIGNEVIARVRALGANL